MVTYWKCDIKIADFLSRHPDSNLDSPIQIIPISFVMKDILPDKENTDNIMSVIQPLIDLLQKG